MRKKKITEVALNSFLGKEVKVFYQNPNDPTKELNDQGILNEVHADRIIIEKNPGSAATDEFCTNMNATHSIDFSLLLAVVPVQKA
jgi:hypothetical protein